MTKQTKTLKNNINECLLVIDFGSQVTQLIARRLRELNVYSKIYPFQNINQKLLKELTPKAIIFSGGPRSVLDRNCLLYTSPSPRDTEVSRMPSSA